MDMLDLGDLRRADCFVTGDDLKKAKCARAHAERVARSIPPIRVNSATTIDSTSPL